MTAPTLQQANPFEDFATPAATALPMAFRAEMNDCDEPLRGELREIFPRTARSGRLDPIALLPGDFLLGEGDSPCWLRVDFVKHGATGSRVHTDSGLRVFVSAGRSVWIWRAADVLARMALGERAGAL